MQIEEVEEQSFVVLSPGLFKELDPNGCTGCSSVRGIECLLMGLISRENLMARHLSTIRSETFERV